MPIKNLTERRRLPRLGKIHTGIKTSNNGGPEYPKAVDYFVVPPEIQAVYGEKPRSLRVCFPGDDESIFASQFYRCYSQRGLLCKGDGEIATRMIDLDTMQFPTRETKETDMVEVPCLGRECEHYGKKCTEVMNLQFLIPDVPGLGVWQLDTGSINAIINVNSTLQLVRSIIGHVSMVPLLLTLEPTDIQVDGRQKKVYVINLRMNKTLNELQSAIKDKTFMLPDGKVDLPVPDDEVPGMIVPQAEEFDKMFPPKPLTVPPVEPSVTDMKRLIAEYMNTLGWHLDELNGWLMNEFALKNTTEIMIPVRKPVLDKLYERAGGVK